jgi:F-type H+-transporting ATPase subunit gamma
MSRRHDVEERIEAFKEIRSILESMKNLAMIETHKLARYHQTQQRVVSSIHDALNDVWRSNVPDTGLPDAPPVYLLFGSERGFCGAYNEQLLSRLEQQPDHLRAPLISIGSRLNGSIRQKYPHAVCLTGAVVAGEATAVLAAIVETLNQLRRQQGPLRLEVIHFTPDSKAPLCEPALPSLAERADRGLPPLLNLPPRQLLGELLEQYLFALANAWFFAALMVENQRRMQHLDQAGHHLEGRMDELAKRRNILRQEEIIEEIEVILLSAESVCVPGIESNGTVHRENRKPLG